MLAGLDEFRYLTVPNAPLYRRVMRYFFEQYLSQRSTLPPEDALEALAAEGILLDLEEVLGVLDQLVDWGNLGRRRDPRRVATLRDYARRRDLYYATPRGLAIEQFLDNGLDAAQDSVTVSAGIVAGILSRLEQLQTLLQAAQPDPEAIESLWVELFRQFSDLSGDLRSLGMNLERRLSLEALAEFLDYKDVVRSYIERLSRELAGSGRRIRLLLQGFSPTQRSTLVALVARVQAGRLTVSAGVVDEGKARERVSAEWAALVGWFGREVGRGDGLEYALESLRSAMRRVLDYVDAVHRTRELGLGRAGELEALARQLDAISNPLQAREQLSRYLGLFAALHPSYDQEDRTAPDPWQQAVATITLHPVQKGRIAAPPSAGVGQTRPEARAAAREATKAFRAKERALLELFKNGRVVLNGLELPNVELLRDLLRYIERGPGTTIGPEGQPIRVEFTSEPALVQGPDWSLWLERGVVLHLLKPEDLALESGHA